MQKRTNAGKPAGKKPDRRGLFGLFAKKKDIPTTAQQTLPYREMYRDGVCRVSEDYYTKTIEYEDINYQLAQAEDQAAIFDGWSACLNYFDSTLPFQLSFLNHRSRPESRYSVNIPMQDDEYNGVRQEYVEMLDNQIARSNNGIVRTKLVTFGVKADSLSSARARLERVEADICGNFKKLGVKSRSLTGLERLELLHGQLHPGGTDPFRFAWDMIPKTGLSTKDFIAPDSFDFRFSRLFRVGTTWGAASYLQILASELSDKLLAELLEMDAEMTITLHIQTVDQAAAVKSIKAKVSDIDKMKVEEQKKAARAGYDMDILPPDLVTYSNDAKTLLEDLQSRNERMFLLTFLVVNMAPTRRELDNDLFTVSGIVQKYNCSLKRLDFQQEAAFLSSLPLGHNGIEIQRGMTTSSTAIFVPFMTQELRMDGEAVYYGLNALSHNVIMANRKKLKNPNGLFLGVPGSGKSFAAKRELVNVFLATRDRIIVVDPMGEYSPLIKRLGGQVIEIAPDSPHHINPMDIDLSFDEENPMALKADFILSLMELIVGGKDGLQPVERTVIDRCVRQMYREHLQNPETAEMPTLQTLYDLLCSQPEGEAVRLATALEIYVSGSLNVFNHETNVDLNRRLVCLDLKKLGAGLRTIAMLIMQDLVNSQVSMNFLRGIATWCYFDEFHVLLRDRLTASYCVAIWKMLRKKGCVPSALTQNVKDFLASPEIENIFENSDFLVLLSQAQGDRQIFPCKDDPNRVVKRVRYICYGKTRKQTDCDGQTGYTAHILDGIIDKLVRQIFERMKAIPKSEIVNARYREKMEERKNLLRSIRADYTKAADELDMLKAEVIKALRGESAFSKDLLGSMVSETEAKCAELQKQFEDAQAAYEEGQTVLHSLEEQYDNVISWADLYDTASLEAKKMIVNCLIKRVEVYRDYKLHIDFNIDFEQFSMGMDIVAIAA